MANENIDQIYTNNPITVNASTDLMYFGQSPYGAGNDAAMTFQDFAAQFSEGSSGIPFGVDSGSNNASIVTFSPPITSLTDGLLISFKPNYTSTISTPTINVDGLGAKNIYFNVYNNIQLVPGDLNSTVPIILQYSSYSGEFSAINPLLSIINNYLYSTNGYLFDSLTASANTYVATSSYSNVPSQEGVIFYFDTNVGNSGASTFSLNGIVNNIVTPNGNPLIGGEIIGNYNVVYQLIFSYGYNAWVLTNSSLNASASPWSAGTGTDSAIGGDGTSTAGGSFSAAYGANNTNAGGAYSWAWGDDCNASQSFSVAWGLNSIVTNRGSWVVSDSNNTPPTDTVANQFNLCFSGGYNFYINNSGTAGSSLAFSADPNANFINNAGTADQSYSLQTPSTGFDITIGAGVTRLILNPGTTLTTGTVVLPAAPIDGQLCKISTTQVITTFTLSPNAGQTISNAPTTLAAGQVIEFLYSLGVTKWFPA